MSISHTHVLSCAVLAACTLAPVAAVRAADAPEAAPSKAEDAAMKEELKYIGALVDANMPDLAEPVIDAAKKKWPQLGPKLKVLEIQGDLRLGRFAEVQKVVDGMKEAGADVTCWTVDDVKADAVTEFDAVAMGCPAMGAEVLEETEFDPMYQSIKASLSGKAVGLFGSYGWGDGEWMRDWENDVKAAGGELVREGVICCEAPDDEAIEACKALGKLLAE